MRNELRCYAPLTFNYSTIQKGSLFTYSKKSLEQFDFNKQDEILSKELKKMAGFGKGGLKNYPGIITGLQMQLYLVITDFQRRKNKKGAEYGMSVSVMFPPEKIWGYELVTSAYSEEPTESCQRIFDHVKELYPKSSNKAVSGLIGKNPID